MPVSARGDGASKVLLLSANQAEEDHYLLGRLIRRAGFQRDHFYFQTLAEFHHGMPADVRVVVPMGEAALQAVTMEPGIARWRGRVVVNSDGRFTIPAYKPSALLPKRRNPFGGYDPDTLRNPPRLQKLFIRDLHYAIHVAQHGFERSAVDYLLDPSPEAFARWVGAYFAELSRVPSTLLSWDIETPYKQKVTEEDDMEESEAAAETNTMVLRHSFSYKSNTAVTIPHDPRYYEATKRLLAAPGAKVGWNCPLPDERVLTADLTWKCAGDLVVGDVLVGFDEKPVAGARRKYKSSTVTHVGRRIAQAVKVVLSDGSEISVSAEHPWLVDNTRGNGSNSCWVPTNELQVGMRVPRLLPTWIADRSYEAGWLAGMADGEGSVDTATGVLRATNISQTAGATFERMQIAATQLQLPLKPVRCTTVDGAKNAAMWQLKATNKADTLKVLGTLRPARLLDKITPELLGAAQAVDKDVFVTALISLGNQEIVELSTSLHTYVLEGFGAHNCIYFDIPVMESHGWEINGTIYDGMDAWHWLYPQLDKGLEAVTADATDMLPWKHLSDAEPEWYSATDADAALRNVLYIHEKIRKAGEAVWTNYQELCVEVMTYMKAAGRRGVPLDLEKQRELTPLMDAEIARLDGLIQTEVEERFKPRKRYKRMPFEGMDQLRPGTVGISVDDGMRYFEPVNAAGDIKRCSVCHTEVSAWGEHMKGRAKPTKKEPEVFNRCKAAGAVAEKVPGMVVEWDEILPFNANSSTQLIAYAKAHKHPLGRNKDTGGDAMDAGHLRELVGMYGEDYPLYSLALSLHDVKKARTTYMPTPDSAGMIHSTYTNTPWTWRFGSRALNMQTWGKREEKVWARQARLQIIARPGWRLVQADSSSAEAVIQGWFMADHDYMNLATQSIHAWLATKYLGWDFNPDTVSKVKKEHKPIYDGMKVANFTINFGGSAYGMHMANKKLFPKKKDADRIVDAVYQLLPSLEAYHWNLRGLAQKQGYIMSPWGIRFDFFDVYTYDRDMGGNIRYTPSGRPRLKLGKDGKAVVAALPQHANGMFSRKNAVIIGRSEWGQYMPANFTVHDAYAVRVPVDLVDAAQEMLVQTLTRPIEELGGLRLGCEVEVGSNWGDYDADKNPEGMRTTHKEVVQQQSLLWTPNFADDFRRASERIAA